MEELLAQLKRHEGLRLSAYQDSLGYWTIGYGRMIDKRKGGGISVEEAERLLRNDVERVDKMLGDVLLNDPVRRAVILNMTFQLGLGGVRNFKRMWEAINREDWEMAAQEGLNSRWAQQTPGRARELMEQLRTGRWK